MPIQSDISWATVITGRFIDGGKLYVDAVEVNPPLFVYLTVPPVLLSRVLGVPAVPTFHAYTVGLVVASVVLCWLLIRQTGMMAGRFSRRCFVLALLASFLPLAGWDFGEREFSFFIPPDRGEIYHRLGYRSAEGKFVVTNTFYPVDAALRSQALTSDREKESR